MKLQLRKLPAWLLLAFLLCLYPGLVSTLSAQDKPTWMDLGARVEASDIPDAQYPVLADWLEKNGKPPLEYALDQCKQHQIVIFGELHGIKDYLDFFHQLIPLAYQQAGMRTVVLESAKFEDNEKIARLLEGQTFDRKLALEIARNAGWSTWNHKEYWDVFEVVWKLNRSLPAGAEPMKVIGMEISVDLELNWQWLNKKLTDPKMIAQAQRESLLIQKRDELMAAAIEMGVIRNGSKGMVWVGWNHAFTHYGQPAVNREGMLYSEFQRMGYLLYQNYGERICQIAMHYQFDSPKMILDNYSGPEPVFSGMLEKIMALRQDKPVGWNVHSSPFGRIRDKHTYNFHFQPKVCFGDLCRGYIFLKPWATLSSCGKIKDFVTAETFQRKRAFYEAMNKRTFKNVGELNAYLESR